VDNLGYVFHRLEEESSLGKRAQLEINIYAQPTGEHYDPQQANFPVAMGDHIELLKVTHPWRGQKQYRVCAGRVRLSDWREKVIEAAIYGGELNITPQESYTYCSLTSSAPIIELKDNVISPEARLAYEIEVLLAKRRAEFHDDKTFEKRLAMVEPLMLFMVSLATVEQKFAQIPGPQRGVRYRAAHKIIQQTIGLLQKSGAWPTSLPTLTELI
jgi:hypothetical protein